MVTTYYGSCEAYPRVCIFGTCLILVDKKIHFPGEWRSGSSLGWGATGFLSPHYLLPHNHILPRGERTGRNVVSRHFFQHLSSYDTHDVTGQLKLASWSFLPTAALLPTMTCLLLIGTDCGKRIESTTPTEGSTKTGRNHAVIDRFQRMSLLRIH